MCDAGSLVFTYFLDPDVPEKVLEAWEQMLVNAVEFIRRGGGGSSDANAAEDDTEGVAAAALSMATRAVAAAGVVVEANTEGRYDQRSRNAMPEFLTP
jgi:putative aminopeptidase FrvX